mmetsp:Transcript_152172/g.280467  ORF Transcript_152172/g.280467 Transcript_152172/m.280467 type:complete len:249 (-) Transcript_152172:1376-2122(-)
MHLLETCTARSVIITATDAIPSSAPVGVVGGIDCSILPQPAIGGVGSTRRDSEWYPIAHPEFAQISLGTQVTTRIVQICFHLCLGLHCIRATDRNPVDLCTTSIHKGLLGFWHRFSAALLESASTGEVLRGASHGPPQPACSGPVCAFPSCGANSFAHPKITQRLIPAQCTAMSVKFHCVLSTNISDFSDLGPTPFIERGPTTVILVSISTRALCGVASPVICIVGLCGAGSLQPTSFETLGASLANP